MRKRMTEKRALDGWEEHRRQQIRDGLSTTPAQRLAWVEEMIELMRKVRDRGALERRSGSGSRGAKHD